MSEFSLGKDTRSNESLLIVDNIIFGRGTVHEIMDELIKITNNLEKDKLNLRHKLDKANNKAIAQQQLTQEYFSNLTGGTLDNGIP